MRVRGFKKIPWSVILLTSVLVATGVAFIRSSTMGTALEGWHRRQILSVVMGLPLFLLAAALPSRFLARSATPLYVLTLIALALVLVVGVEINHARRWFAGPGGFLLQPSELAKPVFVLALARYLEFRPEPNQWHRLIGPLLLMLPPFLLIQAEPDLGTAMMFAAILAGMLYTAGTRRWYFGAGLLGALVLFPLLLSSPLLKDYQKERIRAFQLSVPAMTAQAKEARHRGDTSEAVRVEQQVRDLKRKSGYQSYFAQVSIGSGGWFGQGVGQGPQNRLKYLPERHNDFVFAVVGEEAGLMGSSLLIAGFFLLGALLLRIARGTRDRFGRLVATGAAVALVTQAMANMAMTMGLLPITGLPLPFISQGGSSMMSSLALVGLAVGVGRSRLEAEPFLYRVSRAEDAFAPQVSDGRQRLTPR